MRPLDAVWHLLNLFLPALGMAAIAPSLAKLVWRRALRDVSWMRLALWCGGVTALCLLGGLLLLGRDGRMVTYAAVVVGIALALGWHLGLPGRGKAR